MSTVRESCRCGATFEFHATDPLTPSTTLLCKLGSLIVHADEGSGKNAHPADIDTFLSLLRDPEVVEWLAAMRALALLPVKRS